MPGKDRVNTELSRLLDGALVAVTLREGLHEHQLAGGGGNLLDTFDRDGEAVSAKLSHRAECAQPVTIANDRLFTQAQPAHAHGVPALVTGDGDKPTRLGARE